MLAMIQGKADSADFMKLSSEAWVLLGKTVQTFEEKLDGKSMYIVGDQIALAEYVPFSISRPLHPPLVSRNGTLTTARTQPARRRVLLAYPHRGWRDEARRERDGPARRPVTRGEQGRPEAKGVPHGALCAGQLQDCLPRWAALSVGELGRVGWSRQF